MIRSILLLSALSISLSVKAEVRALNLVTRESVIINCQDSMPVLKGNIVSCEILCQIDVVKKYNEVEVCDQSCWHESEYLETEVTVTQRPLNKIIFQHSMKSSLEVEQTLAEAKLQAQKICTKVQINSK